MSLRCIGHTAALVEKVAQKFLSISDEFTILSPTTCARQAQRLQHVAGKVASIPFRFKAGGSSSGTMAPENHHHRSTTKQNKKTFKSRHATKSSLKELSKGIYCLHSSAGNVLIR